MRWVLSEHILRTLGNYRQTWDKCQTEQMKQAPSHLRNINNVRSRENTSLLGTPDSGLKWSPGRPLVLQNKLATSFITFVLFCFGSCNPRPWASRKQLFSQIGSSPLPAVSPPSSITFKDTIWETALTHSFFHSAYTPLQETGNLPIGSPRLPSLKRELKQIL